MTAAVLPPGYSALRECLKALAPNLASSDQLGANPFITTGTPLYAAWAPQQEAQPDNPWGDGSATSQTAYDPLKAFNDIVEYIPQVDYVYRPSANRVTEAYGLILDSLEFSTVGKTAGLEPLYSQQSTLATSIASIRSEIWNAYLASPQYPSTPFESYLISAPEFQQYQLKVQQLSIVTLEIRQKLGPGGAVANAVTEYNALVNPATAPKVINPWRWGDVDVPGMIQNWRKGADLNPQEVQQAASASDSTSNEYIDQHGGGNGFVVDLFAGGGGGSVTHDVSINKQNEQIALQLQVKAWAQVPVVINDTDSGNKSWYDGALLRAYAQDQYFAAPFTGARTGSNPAYGPNGVYPWRIASVIIAFQPTLTIVMGAQSYAEWHHYYQSKSHWSAGPFGIFGSGSSTRTIDNHTVSTQESKQTVKIENTSQNPVILGMTMEDVP